MEGVQMDDSLRRELEKFSAEHCTRVSDLTNNLKALQLEGLIEIKAQVDVLTLRTFYSIVLTTKGCSFLKSEK
jgi:hypothetical protein